MRKPSDEKDFLLEAEDMLILTKYFSIEDDSFRNEL